jgi:hypothetical protein
VSCVGCVIHAENQDGTFNLAALPTPHPNPGLMKTNVCFHPGFVALEAKAILR